MNNQLFRMGLLLVGIVFVLALGVVDAQTISAPSSLASLGTSTSSVSISWVDNADNESDYRIERSILTTNNWVEVAQLAADSTTYVDSTNIWCSRNYYYRVRASDSSSTYSSYSNTALATTLACTPLQTPSGISVNAVSSYSLTVNWSDPNDSETAYILEMAVGYGSFYTPLVTLASNTSSYTLSDLPCETPHYFRVRAFNAASGGYSSYGAYLNGTTHYCPPTNGLVSNITGSSLDLNWANNTSYGVHTSIEQSLAGQNVWTKLADLDAPETASYTRSGLTCNTSYDYRLSVTNTYGTSTSDYLPLTATTLACPVTPSNLQITGSSSSTISLAWTAVDNVSHYRIERSLNGTGWEIVDLITANNTSYTNIGVKCNTSYIYRLKAFRASDSQFSAYSNEATGATTIGTCILPAPSGLTITGHSGGGLSIYFSWTDNASDESNTRVERSTDAVNWQQVETLWGSWHNYNGFLSCNLTTYYRLRAYRASDNQFSAYSNIISEYIFCSVAAPPTNLIMTGHTPNSITISWTDNSIGENDYKVMRWQNNYGFVIATLPANSTSFTDTGLHCHTEYAYGVGVRPYQGNQGTWGNTGTVMTADCPPLQAAVLTATPTSGSNINLTWTYDSTATGTTIDYYYQGGWVKIYFGGAGPHLHTGLSCGTTYQYRVVTERIQDSSYNSSEPVYATTQPCPPLTTPSAVTVLNASQTMVSLQIPSLPASASSMNLERSLDGSNWTNLGVVSSSYLDTNVFCNSSYQYRLIAYRVNDGQYSSYSAIATTTTATCPMPSAGNLLGIYRAGLWIFVDSNDTANPTNSFNFGDSQWQPLLGDWDGDGVDGVGIYANGEFVMKNLATADAPENRFSFGDAEAGWQVLAGDWNGDGIDSIGLYKEGLFLLSDDNINIQYRFNFGTNEAGWQALAGDWDGNGADGIALYKDGLWQLAESVFNPDTTNQALLYGPNQAGWYAIAGDWNSAGSDSIGLYSAGVWRIRLNNIYDSAEASISFGQANDMPLAISP